MKPDERETGNWIDDGRRRAWKVESGELTPVVRAHARGRRGREAGGEVSCTYCMALMRGLDKWVVTPSRGR